MPKQVPLPPPGFDDLSDDEKIDYLQSLWDRIAATSETIPVPDWHHEIIDERPTVEDGSGAVETHIFRRSHENAAAAARR